MPADIFPNIIRKNYEIHQWRHACAILARDFPSELADIVDVLSRFRLRKSWVATGGGNKSPISSWIDGELGHKGWVPSAVSSVR
jgi:hypothetical protein